MKKVHERHKRLGTRKKHQILSKGQRDLEILKEVRSREEKLADYRYNNRVQQNKQNDSFNKSLDDWSKKGFNTNLLDKDKQNLLSIVEKRVTSKADNLYARRN